MALNSKRMQTFFNEFLITTTTFLNQFANECEDKFFELERKLNKIESNLMIIEQKLASVPSEESSIPKNLPDVEALKGSMNTKEPDIQPSLEKDLGEHPVAPAINQPEATEPNPTDGNLIRISESFTYKKYFKMLKVGIPAQAVKLKMMSEGANSNLLDNPDLMIEKSLDDEEKE